MNIFDIPFIFYYWEEVLFTLKVSSLLSPLNDASGGIVDEEGFYLFSPEAEFASPLYVQITLKQQSLKQNQRASHNCYCVENMLKPLEFK